MPAQRKPEGTRVRRHTNTFDSLPMNGYEGPIPDWPLLVATEFELERWERLWRTAQASQWVRMHIEFTVARYVRLVLTVEADTKNNLATAQTLNTVTSLEDRLGLSPKALQNLSWKIASDEVAEQRDVSVAVRERNLKAVDSDSAVS